MPVQSDGERRGSRSARARPPLVPDDERERKRRGADRRDREHGDAEHGGERVVDEAVGDERVAAGVPEVVPEREAVLEQERALVGVRGQVDTRRAKPDQETGERSARRGPTGRPRGRAADGTSALMPPP